VSILFFHSANLLAKIAERQNRPDDAGIFRGVAEKIRVAYLREYSDLKTGKIGTGSQANQAFAIWTGLVEGDMKAKALKFLIDDIHAHKDHLTTGIMGTKFMLDVLSREGQVDLAYEIVTQPEFPSYAWMLKNGATTLWEHWQFSDNTFSHNHPMFGSVSEWMIKWLGGIQVAPNAKGADRFIIHPSVPKALGHASASYDSIRGRVESRWQKQGGKVTYTIRIPASTEARIILPTGARIVKGKEGLRENIGTIFSVGSGDYVFEATLP
jgi:alpha-L-rhamnosidase